MRTISLSFDNGPEPGIGLLDPEASRAEIARTQALMDGFVTERLFRPIGGAGREGVVLWNVVPRDWERPHTWVDVALEDCRRTDHAVVVLHDLPGGAMTQLPSFLDRALDEGARFSCDFPPSCVAIERGEPRHGLDAYVRTTS